MHVKGKGNEEPIDPEANPCEREGKSEGLKAFLSISVGGPLLPPLAPFSSCIIQACLFSASGRRRKVGERREKMTSKGFLIRLFPFFPPLPREREPQLARCKVPHSFAVAIQYLVEARENIVSKYYFFTWNIILSIQEMVAGKFINTVESCTLLKNADKVWLSCFRRHKVRACTMLQMGNVSE